MWIDLSPGFGVTIQGWAIPLVVLLSLFFVYMYMRAFAQGGLSDTRDPKLVYLLLAANVLSLASAEALATYLFPHTYPIMGNGHHLYNLPWIILNGIGFAVAARYARAKAGRAAVIHVEN